MKTLYTKKISDNLLNVIIGTASILVIIHVVLLFFKESNPVLAEIPMFIPMLYVFAALAALCIIIMSLGRQRVLKDTVSYWTGIAFINIFITNIFYILSWPGLLANGMPIIGHNTNTAAWIMITENILAAIIFLVASLSAWPGKSALRGSQWGISVTGWIFAVILLNILIFQFEDKLPLLVIDDQFTLYSKSSVVLLILIMLSAIIFMTLRYRRTKDQFTGFIALTLVLLLFTCIEQIMSVSRYALLWYLGRLIGVLSYVILLFGLLREYINLYKREEEKGRRLSESERKTNEILNAITDSSFLIDKNWIITQINSKALEFFGMKREEIVDKLYWDVFPVTIGTFIEDNFRKAVAQNITFSFEMHSMVKEAWTEMHLYPSNEGLTVRFRDITERKQMEIDLHESEKKYRELVKYAPTAIYEVDFKTQKFTTVNEAMVLLSGYSKEELLNLSVLDILDDQSKITFQSRIARMFKGEKPDENVEYKVRAKDGRTIYALLNIKFILDEQGKPVGARCVGHDITERKKAEERLHETQALLHTIIETTSDPVYIKDTQSRIIMCNPALERVVGKEAIEIIGKTDSEFYNDSSLGQRLRENDLRVMESGSSISMEEIVKTLDGDRIFISNKAPYKNRDGDITGIIGISHDITERKRIEEALKESEEKYRNIVESANEGIWIVDENRKTTYANYRMASMLGYTVKEMMIKPWKSFVYETDIRLSEIRFKKRINGLVSRESYEYKLKQKDGTPVWVIIHASLLYNKEAMYKGSISLITDITDLKNKEIELKENEIKLRELIATKDKFFNIIAHDLKNPFTSLIGSTELLVDNIDQMGHEQIKTLAYILNESSKNGYGILLNLLDWSRSQTGMLKINPEKINLYKLIDEQIIALSHISSNKEIEMISLVNKDIQFISDKNILSTVLRNLISNSVKFSHRKGVVTISAYPNDSRFIISIRDNGIGISPGKLKNIFTLETKISTPGTENEQGTGLGLKLCKEFIEKIHGEIWVESVEKKGSEFKFSIPYKA